VLSVGRTHSSDRDVNGQREGIPVPTILAPSPDRVAQLIRELQQLETLPEGAEALASNRPLRSGYW